MTTCSSLIDVLQGRSQKANALVRHRRFLCQSNDYQNILKHCDVYKLFFITLLNIYYGSTTVEKVGKLAWKYCYTKGYEPSEDHQTCWHKFFGFDQADDEDDHQEGGDRHASDSAPL